MSITRLAFDHRMESLVYIRNLILSEVFGFVRSRLRSPIQGEPLVNFNARINPGPRAFVVSSAMLLMLTAVQSASGQVGVQDAPVKDLIIEGEAFLVDQRPAFIFWPAKEKRQSPQPWIMYAPTLPPYPDKHEKWMHEKFVEGGVAVAGIDIGEAYGSPQGQQLFTALYRELTENRGFATKPCLLGRSRGGLWVTSWAINNPEKVAGIAGIYPVFDLRSYPGLNRAAPAYGLSREDLESALEQYNPISRVDVLAKSKIPVFLIHGDIDRVVPLKQNSGELIKRYQRADAGSIAELVLAKGQGHNVWKGFFQCQELIDFAIDQAKGNEPADEN